MTLTYPFLQILLYLSLLLAPPEADRIIISSEYPYPFITELRRDGTNWTLTQNGRASTVSLAGDTLVTLGNGKEERLDLADYVAPALRHDWAASPKLALHDSIALEKTSAGHLHLTDTSARFPFANRHTVHFAQPGEICVHVRDSVNNPGPYVLPAGSTLLDAIAAAGGRNRLSLRDSVTLIRRTDGDKTETITINTKQFEQGETTDPVPQNVPVLQDGDVIVVPEIICF